MPDGEMGFASADLADNQKSLIATRIALFRESGS
jgi:hypothetical protein